MHIKSILLGALGLAMMSSCTLVHQTNATNNPIGTKVGVSKGTNFSKDLDISYSAAAKKGKIDKIGATEFKVKSFLFINSFKTTVWGE